MWFQPQHKQPHDLTEVGLCTASLVYSEQTFDENMRTLLRCCVDDQMFWIMSDIQVTAVFLGGGRCRGFDSQRKQTAQSTSQASAESFGGGKERS